jgi:hypothetical protein
VTEEYDYKKPFSTPEQLADQFYEEHKATVESGEIAFWRETIASAIEADRQQVRDYITAHEHPDDWGVPCIYVERLRKNLDMPPSRPVEFQYDDEKEEA